jgi:hypothetical protein
MKLRPALMQMLESLSMQEQPLDHWHRGTHGLCLHRRRRSISVAYDSG